MYIVESKTMVKKKTDDKLDEILEKITQMKGLKDDKELGRETRSLESMVLDLKKLQGTGGFDRAKYNKEFIQKKRAEDPGYGKPEIIKDLMGTIFYNGKPLILVDNYILFRKKSGWDGWANLTGRFLTPEIESFLRTHQTAEYVIEVEKDGHKYQSRVRGSIFHGGGRRYRLEFEGLGPLNLGGQ